MVLKSLVMLGHGWIVLVWKLYVIFRIISWIIKLYKNVHFKHMLDHEFK